jgi:hypothetical protein
MMGTLAKYLQQEFKSRLNSEWICSDEIRILSPDLEKFLGYQPRADLMLQHSDGRRFWIEFETSRNQTLKLSTFIRDRARKTEYRS